jgi:hypothetical protein
MERTCIQLNQNVINLLKNKMAILSIEDNILVFKIIINPDTLQKSFDKLKEEGGGN